MKRINVVLAFHAHEPSWDLPASVIAALRDDDVRREAVGNDNWVKRRAESGRDIYANLLAFGEQLGAPVCLEATNEILMQVRRYMPATFDRLGEAYRSGAIYPVYGNAFHTHVAMIGDDELADELRLNRELLRDVLRAPEPRHLGAFPMEGSIDARRLEGFRRAGMEYVIFPNLSPKKARYAFDGLPEGADPVYGAFTIDQGLLALPRHFPISQEIWRPITRWAPERLAPQGYILGKYRVLDAEYVLDRTVDFPIARDDAVAEYTDVLRQALRDAPDGGLLLYIQDLELMDFGEEALDILGEAWGVVRGEGIANVDFVTPDDYIDEVKASGRQLPHMRFHQASWAPEIRLVLRSDGHYPPLHAGSFRGVDNDVEVFRRWPFIFWEPGRFITSAFKSVLASFGHELDLSMSGAELDACIDDLAGLDDGARLALHMRAMQRACNFGWQPDEARHKWPYMHGLAICEILRAEFADPTVAERVTRGFQPLPPLALRGLDRVLEIIVDTRVAYLRRGIERLGERAGSQEKRAESEEHLRNAEKRRTRASALARQLQAENAKLVAAGAPDERAVQRVLALLQEHCKEAYLAVNEIQRAWMCIDDTAGMIDEMYDYLYDLYPPLFPSILRDLLSPEELAVVEDPPLA
ncbi:MAG: glycoside hydrolase [Dehalococcoidia bacterium]|nr:MAG: glycoside hydrolase [Dehalococcoidia bacterium]